MTFVNLRTPVNFTSPSDATSLITHKSKATTTMSVCAYIRSQVLSAIPTDFAGLSLWLKADALNGFADSDAVATWADSSGLGNNAVQATGANKPLYKINIINGLPVLRFDGSNDFMTTSLGIPTKFTAFVVYANRTGTNGTMLGSSDTLLIERDTTIFPNGGGASFAVSSLNSHKLLSLSFDYDNDLYSAFSDGVANGSSVSVAAALSANWGLGSRGGASEFLAGDVAEVIVYNSLLTQLQRQQIETYLSLKYGITNPNMVGVIGMTSWSDSLSSVPGYSGVVFKATTGVTASKAETTEGSRAANMEADVFLLTAGISEADLYAGIWNHAEATVFVLNYNDLTMGQIVIISGYLGQFVQKGQLFTTEIQSYSNALGIQIGTVTRPECANDLGDARCQVDLTTFTKTGTLTSVTSTGVFIDTSRTETTDYFQNGKIKFTSGPNAGLGFFQIDSWDAATKTFTLRRPVPYLPIVGDAYTAIRGCRKRADADCTVKFANRVNFNGADYMDTYENIIRLPTV